MSTKPVIGITLDIENIPTYAHEPWYALRENYCSSIRKAGGLPVGLAHEIDVVDNYLDMVDGLVISGGMYDIHPELYGEAKIEGELVTKDSRTQFEFALVRGALARDIPLIGICGGMQVLAVINGAKLVQDIRTEVQDSLNHMQPLPHNEPSHTVSFMPGSLICKLFGKEKVGVNSVHHQSVKDLPPKIMVSAVAEDQVIEAIEIPGQTFCLGFQWHPEYLISKGEFNVFEAFIAAARNTRD
ncbi:MAG: gamma-glutamyl-gamma-aminobutyrate hydrolase family protein [Oceanospirillales bacterium]|nr:gamma-glutamyl-gamma-aminobutyrate hydrolase family protein [Oceanospirillales bacterium]MBR9886316.1 gamma-glutamyl-gamma-aminobutyrate hydrolase family protein [Oceanospirillales bacterium]